MLSMAKQKKGKLNYLAHHLPEGLLVDAAWLSKKGYSTSLRSQYVAAGWLEQPARQVYRRPRGSLSWQQVVISLQTLLGYPLIVGGRTAVELQGYAHYLPHQTKEVHLFGSEDIPRDIKDLASNAHARRRTDADLPHGGLIVQPWGQWDWPLTLSTPERAVLELLDELPKREGFHQVDKLMEGLTNLSPRRLQKLLSDCRSVKVKRLFLFFADRHQHAWTKRLKKDDIDLGKGERMLVKGGKLNSTYQITVPEDLIGLQ